MTNIQKPLARVGRIGEKGNKLVLNGNSVMLNDKNAMRLHNIVRVLAGHD